MQTGDFFRAFFRGKLGEPNAAGEIPVCCPFPHKREDGTEYFEKNPSAHVNLGRGVFHCKVCRGLGRFNDGGLSEVAFYAAINEVSYMDAVVMLNMMSRSNQNKRDAWQQHVDNLLSSPQQAYDLGFTDETIRTLQLGYSGEGIEFPVFVHGELLDVRTYRPDGQPKVLGQKDSKPLIFPFDLWLEDDRPTLLCEGEKDCAIARQMGFNAITITGGAGSFPKVLRNYFKSRDVYIAYDCDDAGRSGARVVAFHLHGVANTIRIVDLGLAEKEDIHDFFIKYNRRPEDLFQLMEKAPLFTPEDYQAEKAQLFPLVDLWDAPKGKYVGKVLSSRVIVSGSYDAPMEAPVAVEWRCKKFDPEEAVCKACPFRHRHEDRPFLWTLTEENSDQLLKLVDSGLKEAQVNKNLRQFVGIPEECPGHEKTVRMRMSIKKTILVPDAESTVKDDPMADFKSAELVAYILEQDKIDVIDGQRYRVFYKRYPHPLQAQRIVLVVHQVEQSDNPVNTFRITPEIRESLKVFQGSPKEKMLELAERAKAIIGPHAHPMLVYATDLIYHSPLQFYFGGKLIEKGYPEGAIIGESRTGKTNVAAGLLKWYDLGTYTDCKNASVAGMIGGAEKTPYGGHKLTWGVLPRNHKGLVVLDEFSGMPVEVMSKLTSVRSSMVARIEKIARGAAPAWTRLLWISNPRVQSNKQSLPLYMYPSGIEVLLELFGSDEDIARFDFAYLIATPSEFESPLTKAKMEPFDRELYRQLVYWAWSRKPEQIIFEEGVEELIVDRGKLLNEKYPCNVKIFGAEAWKKIARLAVATACRLFSCDDSGEHVVVKESHVDFACRFLVDCYDNELFRLRQYVDARRHYTETDESVNKVVAKLCRQYPAVIRLLAQTTETTLRQLQASSGLDNREFNLLYAELTDYFLIQPQGDKIQPSFRLRKALDAVRKMAQQTHLQPLGTGGQ